MRRSIRRQLIVLTAGASTAIVGLVCAVVGWRVNAVLWENFDQALLSEAASLAGLLEFDEGAIQFEAGPLFARHASARSDALICITTLDGQLVFRSGPCELHADSAAPAAPSGAADATANSATSFDTFRCGDQDFRTVSLRTIAACDEDEAPPQASYGNLVASVRLARPLAPLRQTQQELLAALGAAAVTALAAAMLIAAAVARRAVAPIREIADVIGNVEPGAPRLPLNGRHVPRELDPIVAKTDDLLERIRAELTRQRQLTADIAHDLRTPVAGTRTLLEVCAQRRRTPDEYQETLETAQNSLRRLSALLDDVLALARLDAAVDRPAVQEMKFAAVFAAARDAVLPLANSRNVQIDLAGESELLLTSDRAKLAKILSNLLANAVEHGPANSTVTVRVRALEGSVEVRVEDRGAGIPPALRDKIFNRFSRGDDARAGDGHHGLGLPIARGLARILGGELTYEHGSVSTFVLSLPRFAPLL